MNLQGYQVNLSQLSDNGYDLDSCHETYETLTEAISIAEQSWSTGAFEMITVIDWLPLAVNKYPKIAWLRHKSTSSRWKTLFDNGSEKLLMPLFSPSETTHFGFRVAAGEFQVTEPKYVYAEGSISSDDNVNSVLAKICETVWKASHLFNLPKTLYFCGFYIDSNCAKFVFSDEIN